MKTVSILLSRQPLRPCGNTPWVQQTRKAIQWIKNQHLTLVTSTGMQTWDLITSLGSIEKIPMIIFDHFPPNKRMEARERLLDCFNLDQSQVEIIPVSNSSPDSSLKKLQHIRDQVVVERSDILIPISIRAGGRMNELIGDAGIKEKNIINTFGCPYQSQGQSLSYSISPNEISSDAMNLDDRYLFHWTRTCNDPWPDEKPIDYYTVIIDSSHYPRSAFDTLMRIIHSRLLIATSRHMPENIPTVSFSGLSPVEIRPLIRWRGRYTQMSFEPYGIGIEKHAAFRAGIRPVTYIEGKRAVSGNETDIWLTQSKGIKTDWRNEHEFRYRGNFPLAQFSDNDLIIIGRTQGEADRIHLETKLKVISFCRS